MFNAMGRACCDACMCVDGLVDGAGCGCGVMLVPPMLAPFDFVKYFKSFTLGAIT